MLKLFWKYISFIKLQIIHFIRKEKQSLLCCKFDWHWWACTNQIHPRRSNCYYYQEKPKNGSGRYTNSKFICKTKTYKSNWCILFIFVHEAVKTSKNVVLAITKSTTKDMHDYEMKILNYFWPNMISVNISKYTCTDLISFYNKNNDLMLNWIFMIWNIFKRLNGA